MGLVVAETHCRYRGVRRRTWSKRASDEIERIEEAEMLVVGDNESPRMVSHVNTAC